MKTLYERISPDFNDNLSHEAVMKARDRPSNLRRKMKNENR